MGKIVRRLWWWRPVVGDEAMNKGHLVPDAVSARTPARNMDLRTYGIGAQILRHLGVHRMKLLGLPRRMPSMTGYGLEVTGWVAPPSKE